MFKFETTLRHSHIIPKFVFDYFKATGGKYMRTYTQPNKRIQDGPKLYLLSEKAEQTFSERERWFAKNIFIPYMQSEQKSFHYNEHFAYFIISVLWRTLKLQMTDPKISNNPSLHFLNDVSEVWRKFLADSQFPLFHSDLNIFLTDRMKSHNTKGMNADLYTSRMIDATIITNKDYSKVAVYVKFLRFMFWSVVKGEINESKETKILFNNGELKTPQYLRDDFFGNFLMNRIKIIDERPLASPLQQQKIAEEISKSELNFWNTDAGMSMINDFNQNAFR